MTRFPRRLGGLAGLLLGTLLLTAGGVASADPATPPTPASAERGDEAAGMSLARLAVCEDVVDRAPVGEKDTFAKGVGRLWCFTDVRGAASGTQVFHRWYIGDRLVSEIPITVKGRRWRCWSRKTIHPKWEGPARVEVLTEEGDVLGTVEFMLE